MEPFGLLNLLSSRLPKMQEPPSAAPKNTPENGNISKEKTDDSTAQTPLQAPTQTPSSPPPTPPSNACLEFLDRHDKRVKRTKKQ